MAPSQAPSVPGPAPPLPPAPPSHPSSALGAIFYPLPLSTAPPLMSTTEICVLDEDKNEVE